MFSKPKRFPDGSYKYINLPQEELVLAPPPAYFSSKYDIEPNRRGSIGLEFLLSESYIIPQNSSTTTSSARTSSDDSSSILNISISRSNTTASIKRLPSPTLPDTQKQIEVETLLAKIKKMEATIQSLETDKKDREAILVAKDMELEDLRSTNSVLKENVNRQEALYLKVCKQLEEEKGRVHDLDEKIQKDSLIICDLMQQSQPMQNEESEIGKLKAQIQSMTEQNKSDMHALNNENQELNRQKTQLELCLTVKEEEMDALLNKLDEKEVESQKKFTEYREYMESTVIPYLRNKKRDMEEFPSKEYNRVLSELYEAKKFINKQAQHMDELKANVYWLSVKNNQLNTAITMTNKDSKEQLLFIRKLLFHAHSLQLPAGSV